MGEWPRAASVTGGASPTPGNLPDRGLLIQEWSGAPDLNPGPHGPEPSWLRVLECAASSAEVRLNSDCRISVSVHVLVGPPGAGNLCPGGAPAAYSDQRDDKAPTAPCLCEVDPRQSPQVLVE